MIFSQLVCRGCRKILTYPYTAYSCACRNCGTVNAAQFLRLDCPRCEKELMVPINTLSMLCPLCGAVTDIPESLLPQLEEPVDLGGMDGAGGGEDDATQTIYVTYPDLAPLTQETKRQRERRLEAVKRGKEKEQRLRERLLHQEMDGAPAREEEEDSTRERRTREEEEAEREDEEEEAERESTTAAAPTGASRNSGRALRPRSTVAIATRIL